MDPNKPQQPLPPVPEQTPTPKLQTAQMFSNPTDGKTTDPYAFITDAKTSSAKKPLIPANSTRSRLLFAGAAGMVLLIGAVIATSVIGNAGKGNTASLQTLVAEQQEILRISKYGITEGRDANILNLATTAQLSIATDQLKLESFLKSKKIKTTAVQLAAKKDESTDLKLKTAQDSNNFDAEFKVIILAMLNTYMTNASTAYKSASSPESKKILEDSYNSAEVLIKFYSEVATQ